VTAHKPSGQATAEVFAGSTRWGCDAADAADFLRGLPDRAVQLVFTSPPYESQRTYGLGFSLRGQAWVDWFRPVVVEAARVSAGLVIVNAAGPVEDGSYSPSMEWLVADLTRRDGLVCGPAPWCWSKVCGIPGSGGERYQRRDWEPLYAFCLPDRLPLIGTNNTAFGRPPRQPPGGEFSTRNRNGVRDNDPWKTANRGGSGCGGRRPSGEKQAGPKGPRHTKRVRGADGDAMRDQAYAAPKIANPGNVIAARVGGGHLGHPIAHKGEAAMPLSLAERFVCWYCPPDGIVCDPFAGTGTTAHAAILHGRRFVGADIRPSQVELVGRRMRTVTPSLLVDTAEKAKGLLVKRNPATE